MRSVLFLALLGLLMSASASASDVDKVFDCVVKVAPEGAEPGAPPPPNPQTCIGLIADPCEQAGGDSSQCNARETKAWISAIESVGSNATADYGKKNATAFKAGTAALLKNSAALCRASAATSAWGMDAISKGEDPTKFNGSHPCVREAVAQQALLVLTWRMGN